jgi:hypothetical protein
VDGRVSLGSFGPSGRDPLRLIQDVRTGATSVDIGDGVTVPWEGWSRTGRIRPIACDQYVRIGTNTEFGPGVENIAPRMQGQLIRSRAESRPTPDVELSKIEAARRQVAAGRHAEAIKSLRSYMKEFPDDAIVTRQFAITLLNAGKLDDGFAMLHSAYRLDPGLADVPTTPEEIGISSKQLRDLVTKTVGFANRLKGSPDAGSAWLGVATLMHAEGRVNLASKMLDRAKDAGLPEDLHLAIRASLERIPVPDL